MNWCNISDLQILVVYNEYKTQYNLKTNNLRCNENSWK